MISPALMSLSNCQNPEELRELQKYAGGIKEEIEELQVSLDHAAGAFGP
jgi:hypothetical protein